LDAPLTRPRNAQRGQRMNHKKAIAEKLGKQSWILLGIGRIAVRCSRYATFKANLR
jgi:hypothetical protein